MPVALRSVLATLLAATALVVATPAQAVTATHLWAMDEPDGGIMLDTGAPTQTPGSWENIQAGVPGVVGTGYRFNGSSSRVVVNDAASLDPGTSPFTSTAYVNFTVIPTSAIGGDYDLIRKGLSSTKGGYWKMEIDPNKDGTKALGLCQMKGSLGRTKILNAPHSLNDGQWHTITCTKNNAGLTLTVDGTSYFKAATIGSIANAAPLTLGAKNIGGDWYDGDMDDISLQISGGNTPPTAQNVTVSTNVNLAKSVVLAGTDPETCELTFIPDATSAQGGVVSGLTDNACTAGSPNQDTATVTYSPPADFTGQDAFTYKVNDGTSDSNVATVTINVSSTSTGILLGSSSSAANTTATTLEIPAPPGIQSGDVMVAEVAVRATPTITAPSDWVLIRTDVSDTPVTQSAYYKVATASEPASYTWTFSSSLAAAGGILDYQGANTSNPIDAHGGQVNVKSASLTAPSITTTASGDALVAFFDVTQINTVAAPASMTERFDLASNAVQPYLTAEGADEIQAVAGDTGTRVATASLAGKSIGQLIAVRPA